MFIDKKYMLTEYSLSVSHIYFAICMTLGNWNHIRLHLCALIKKPKKKKKTSPLG